MLEVVLNKSTERKYMKHRPNQKHDAQLLGCLLVKPGSNNRLKKKLDTTSVTITTATTTTNTTLQQPLIMILRIKSNCHNLICKLESQKTYQYP